MATPPTAALIFISYSSKDEQFTRKELVSQLKVLRQKFDTFVADKIEAGQNWRDEIAKAINEASAAILVVSQHSLTSDEVEKELARLLQRREQEGERFRFIPLIYGICPWQELDWLNVIEARPKGEPLEMLEPVQRRKILSDLAVEVSKFIRTQRDEEAAEPRAPSISPDRATRPGSSLRDASRRPTHRAPEPHARRPAQLGAGAKKAKVPRKDPFGDLLSPPRSPDYTKMPREAKRATPESADDRRLKSGEHPLPRAARSDN